VAKVQREQRINTMNRGRGNVGSIPVRIRRENAPLKDYERKTENRVGNFQKSKWREQFQSRLGQSGIARARFVEDDLRDEKLVPSPATLPPVARTLLASYLHHVASWPRHEVTWDGCFHKDSHGLRSSSDGTSEFAVYEATGRVIPAELKYDFAHGFNISYCEAMGKRVKSLA
jgi:hypothetical protein